MAQRMFLGGESCGIEIAIGLDDLTTQSHCCLNLEPIGSFRH
jgi:hypothetical protein